MTLASQVIAVLEDVGPVTNTVSTLGRSPEAGLRSMVKYQGKEYELIQKKDKKSTIKSEDGSEQDVDSDQLE